MVRKYRPVYAPNRERARDIDRAAVAADLAADRMSSNISTNSSNERREQVSRRLAAEPRERNT